MATKSLVRRSYTQIQSHMLLLLLLAKHVNLKQFSKRIAMKLCKNEIELWKLIALYLLKIMNK